MIPGNITSETLYPELQTYLLERKWQEKECITCNTKFFSKSRAKVCGENKCLNGYTFLSRDPKKKLRITQIRDIIDRYFRTRNYKKIMPRNLINNDSSTLFATAGVQCIEEMIKSDEPMREEQGYVFQPSFRSQTIATISANTRDSCYAFVNIATIHPNCSIQEHLRHLDNWITVLSKLGYYAGDITLVPYYTYPDWGTGKFHKLGIRFLYLGLELGVANYCLDIPRGYRSIKLSEIGFGLERIVWGLGKREDLHDHLELEEYGMAVPKERYDLTRLMTLMSMSGLRPSNHGPGYRFRQVARLFVEKGYGHTLVEREVRVAFSFWNSLLEKDMTPKQSITVINEALERSYNIMLLNKLHIDISTKLLLLHPEELIKSLLDRGVSYSILKSTVKGMHVQF